MAETKTERTVSDVVPEYIPGVSLVRVRVTNSSWEGDTYFIFRSVAEGFFVVVNETPVHDPNPLKVEYMALDNLTLMFGKQTAQMADRLTSFQTA